MSISDRLLGKKNVNGKPHIEAVAPSFALPGGEVRIIGRSLRPPELRRPSVHFGDIEGTVLISSDDFVVARVPEGAASGPVVVSTNGHVSNAHSIEVAVPVADNLHPVANPAYDRDNGAIYTTLSGSRGQKVPVSVHKITPDHGSEPFLTDVINPTGLAFSPGGEMFISSRYDGTVYRVTPFKEAEEFARNLGIATGIAFDSDGRMFVGDRSGTIYLVNEIGEGTSFATLEASMAGYHVAFGPDGYLYVAGPTLSSFDSVMRISRDGEVSRFFS